MHRIVAKCFVCEQTLLCLRAEIDGDREAVDWSKQDLSKPPEIPRLNVRLVCVPCYEEIGAPGIVGISSRFLRKAALVAELKK